MDMQVPPREITIDGYTVVTTASGTEFRPEPEVVQEYAKGVFQAVGCFGLAFFCFASWVLNKVVEGIWIWGAITVVAILLVPITHRYARRARYSVLRKESRILVVENGGRIVYGGEEVLPAGVIRRLWVERIRIDEGTDEFAVNAEVLRERPVRIPLPVPGAWPDATRTTVYNPDVTKRFAQELAKALQVTVEIDA